MLNVTTDEYFHDLMGNFLKEKEALREPAHPGEELSSKPKLHGTVVYRTRMCSKVEELNETSKFST